MLALTFLSGCRLGSTEGHTGKVTLLVTRHYGVKTIRLAKANAAKEETVLRFMRGEVDLETAYGGNFINSIEGLKSGFTGSGRERLDWFFYVNGVESGTGVAETKIYPGDSVWWDYHDWSYVQRVPAVVGNYPQPFESGSEGKRFAVRLECADTSGDACDHVEKQLSKLGIAVGRSEPSRIKAEGLIRVLVGTFSDVEKAEAVEALQEGPKRSGVFATFTDGGKSLQLYSQDGGKTKVLRENVGLVAATVTGESPPVWLVLGSDKTGLLSAASKLNRGDLYRKFAVAVSGDRTYGLPFERASSP